MHGLPPLNGLRAFEAAARHLSLTKAAAELNVSPGAISHQIRGLEALLGVQLFERRVRAIVLTAAGKLLYPGVQTGFVHLREAVAGLKQSDTARVLVVSTPPGLTAKWLAPRLYRFANAHPEIDTRISSSLNNANFTTDGVHVAISHMAEHPATDPTLEMESPRELVRQRLDLGEAVCACRPYCLLVQLHGLHRPPLDTRHFSCHEGMTAAKVLRTVLRPALKFAQVSLEGGIEP